MPEHPRDPNAMLVDVTVLDQLDPVVDLEVSFARPRIADVSQAVREALAALPALGGLEQGQIVAVTAGSRGIANIATILREVCAYLRGRGVEPVVVSAMGSHGGNTAQGQRDLLASLGMTEESLGAKLLCSTETVPLGPTPDGLPVHIDRYVLERASGILLVNRVKPHTAFRSSTESGLLKMIAVGLGHQPGASLVHALGPPRMGEAIRSMARIALDRLPVLGGIAILENAYDETARLVAVASQHLLSCEEELLLEARSMMPRLPVPKADLLIVEQIGKEISGTGMDTNIIGRGTPGEAPDGGIPEFRRVLVLGLTAASHGNATGIGLADFTTDGVVAGMDRLSTYTNCLTSTLIDRARLPLFFPDDRQAVAAAIISLGPAARNSARVVQIRDTLHLSGVRVSRNLLESLEVPPGASIKVLDETADPAAQPGPLLFDCGGRLARLPA